MNNAAAQAGSDAADSALRDVTERASRGVAGVEAAGLSLRRDGGGVRTVAPTGETANGLDEAQRVSGTGPCLSAIDTHSVVVVEDLTTDERWPAMHNPATNAGMRSVLSLPLTANGSSLGALNLYATGPGAFDEQAQRVGAAFAAQATSALRYQQLIQAEGIPDEAARLAAVHRYRILDTPQDGAFDRICAIAARFCRTPIATVTIVDEDRIWFKAVQGIDVTETPRGPGLCASAILSGEPYVVTDAATDPRVLANPLVGGELGLRFYAAAPVTTHDGFRLGTVNVIDTEPREVSDGELATLQDLASVVAEELELRLSSMHAISDERTQRRHDSTTLAELVATLRHNLLPPRLPQVPGVQLAAHYHPADPLEIGGDFYDVFPVGGESWKLLLGDMCGKGPNAAAMASLVRYTLRSAAIINQDPVKDLYSLNDTILLHANGSGEQRFCTVVCARLEPAQTGARLTVADGGHPPVLVLRADGTIEDSKGGGTLVGALTDAKFAACTIDLSPGDVAVFYTDGIIEARSRGGLFGSEGLADALGGYAGKPASEVIAGLRYLLADFDPPPDDDVALLALGVPTPDVHS